MGAPGAMTPLAPSVPAPEIDPSSRRGLFDRSRTAEPPAPRPAAPARDEAPPRRGLFGKDRATPRPAPQDQPAARDEAARQKQQRAAEQSDLAPSPRGASTAAKVAATTAGAGAAGAGAAATAATRGTTKGVGSAAPAADADRSGGIGTRPPMSATPPNDVPPEPEPEKEGSNRRNLLLLGLAALVALLLAAGAFFLLRGDSDEPPTATVPTTRPADPGAADDGAPGETTGGDPATTGADPAAPDPGTGDGPASDVTVNGVVELSVVAPTAGAECDSVADDYRVRVLDDSGETMAITPLIEGRGVDGAGGANRLRCQFDYWVRISDGPPELTFELLDGHPDEGATNVLVSQVVSSDLVGNGSGPQLTYTDPG